MTSYQSKIRAAKLAAARKLKYTKADVKAPDVTKSDLAELYKQLDKLYSQVGTALDAINSRSEKADKLIEGKLVGLNNQVVSLMTKITTGVKVDNLGEIKLPKEKNITIPDSFKIDNIDDIATKDGIDEVNKNLANIADQLGSLEPLKPGQEPQDFVPFRRVVKNGKRLEFDDSSWGSGRGGGSTFDTTGLATEAKQDDIITAIGSPTANDVIMREKSDDSDIIYIGEAANATATSAASWKITKLDLNTLLDVTYADGNLNYDNVWDNRESLTYS